MAAGLGGATSRPFAFQGRVRHSEGAMMPALTEKTRLAREYQVLANAYETVSKQLQRKNSSSPEDNASLIEARELALFKSEQARIALQDYCKSHDHEKPVTQT